MKITIEYDPMAGYLFKDGEAQGWVDDILHFTLHTAEDRDDWVITVASALLVNYFRLRIAQGIIKPEQIQFKFNDEIIRVDKFGSLERWPKGFCDKTDDVLMELLTIGSKAVKDRKKARNLAHGNKTVL